MILNKIVLLVGQEAPTIIIIIIIIIITTLVIIIIIIAGSDYETLIRYSEPDKEILRTEFSITVIVKVVPDQNHSFGDDGNDEV